jgi:predicted DNA-binding protein
MSNSDHRQNCAEVASELEQLSERLGDISMSLVREAIEQGSGRPEDDKVLVQARRSVDKAVDLLRRLTTR